MQKLVSIDLKADFGFFRKPDTNSTVNLSYSTIHKPALLGILGAVIGLDGFKEVGKLPVYYDILKDIKIGIEPLEHEKGSYQKTIIKYTNNIGYANNGSNYLTEEATLIKPSYRIYLLLNFEDKYQKQLFEYLKAGKTEYLPYFGKNEFSAWFENFEDNYPVEMNVFNGEQYEIKSIFSKSIIVKDSLADNDDEFTNIDMDFTNSESPFIYFERLPIEYDTFVPTPVHQPDLKKGKVVRTVPIIQYRLEDFSFTSGKMKPHVRLPNLFRIQQNEYVQLF